MSYIKIISPYPQIRGKKMYKTRYLYSELPKTAYYHDDFNGEGVWFNLPVIPSFIHSNDFREFNGRTIEQIADFLENYFENYWQFEIDRLKDFCNFRKTN
jgi:hypothetical protein